MTAVFVSSIRVGPKAGTQLAMTEKSLYSASDQAIALFSVDCRVKPGHDELGLTDGI
jgi:hypothetical protein